MKKKYHGWIVLETTSKVESYRAKWHDEKGKMVTSKVFHSPAEVIKFWDRRLNDVIGLEPTPLGFRVWTEAAE